MAERHRQPVAQEPDARRESLWTLGVGPVVWSVHFLACYVLAAVWCARLGRTAALGEVRWWVAGFTLGALLALLWLGWGGWRRARFGPRHSTHLDRAPDRHRFLGRVAVMLAVLSAVGVLFVAATVVLIGDCA